MAKFGRIMNDTTGVISHSDVTKEFNILASATGKPSVNPMADGIIGTYPVLLADDTTEEYAFFSFHVPDNWKSGTDINVHIHYMNVSLQSGTNELVLGIQYTSVGDGEDGTPTPTTVEIKETLSNNQAADTMRESASLALAAANLAADDSVGVKLYRKAASLEDTMTGDLAIDGIHIEYTSNRL